MRSWTVRTIDETLSTVALMDDGILTGYLDVSSTVAANKIGRLWAESDPDEAEAR